VIGLIGDVPRIHVRARPDAPALVEGARTTTWAHLDERVQRIANGLVGAGLSGARVAVLARNCSAYLELLFGVARARAVFVGLNWRLTAAELGEILDDAAVGLVFVADDLAGGVPEGTLSIRLSGYEAWVADQDVGAVAADPHPDDVVIQMYTSGTTGRPKGVMVSHRNAFASLASWVAPGEPWAQLTPDDVMLMYLPLFHIGGMLTAFFALYHGTPNVLIAEFDLDTILDHVDALPVRCLNLVPAMVQRLIEHPRAATTDFSRFRAVLYGAAPMSPDLLRRAIDVLGCDFGQNYGMTEASGLATYLPARDHDPAGNRRMESVGIPFPGVEVRIVDAEGEEVPSGVVGEICVRSGGVMKGYWRDEAATTDVRRDGWLFTGDAGEVDADGYLYLRDRLRDMIVSGGENIYSTEVESAVAAHPDVAEVTVIAVPHPVWGETPKALVVRRPGTAPDPSAIIATASERLARFKLPTSIDFVDELPRNASGKVRKDVLRASYWSSPG
jgi:long-chain acyl-CoA synthetase